MKCDCLFVLVAGLLLCSEVCWAQKADWPEPRHDGQLTSIQPVAGDLKTAPSIIGEIDLERPRPAWIQVKMGPNRPDRRFTIIAGELRAYDTSGRLIWATHPRDINFSQIVATGDLSDDGHVQLAMTAGRSAEPYGAAMLVSAEDGSIIWRYDVEPMSYSWQLYVLDRAGTGGNAPGPKQLFVVMQGYPPDTKNGYCVLFAHSPGKGLPQDGWRQKWRYDFSQYTCFPNVFQLDLNGDGFYDDIPIISHSRMWLMDRRDGTVKQFLQWDTSPANHRSYGLNKFVDLDGDGRLDFLCLGYFAKHYEVLLNKDGKFAEAWHYGWDDSVTTSNVGLTWPLPPYADVDGDGKLDVVVSVFNADGKRQWEIRVHDAVTGKLKYRMPGMIAARLVDVDGDGVAEILADRSDEGSDAGDFGDYTIHHPRGAALLKVKDGKLQPIWEDRAAVAIREESNPSADQDHETDKTLARVRVGQEVRILQKDQTGSIVSTWDPTSAAPAAPAPFLGTPEILAADFFGEGRNQLLVYRAGIATIWRWEAGHFESAGRYKSSCLPVISDLNGDGRLDLVLADVSAKHEPRYKAVTPALNDHVLWDVTLPPPAHAGMPAVRLAYMRAGKFTGRKQDDLYIWAATPFMRSAVLRGDTGSLVWDKYESSVAERYWGPSMNLASVDDFNGDGKEDLVFTNPDEYCVADGPTGNPLLGPLNQQKIFNQPSLGLYTMPVILGEQYANSKMLDGGINDAQHSALGTRDFEPTVCLVGGHYYQAALTLHAKPMWYKLPPTGEARCANEGFINIGSNTEPQWLMGFGRQNGKFACINVADGSVRWEFDTGGSCSDVVGCDIDGDGRQEFIFGTSHGTIYAVGDDAGKPRIVWKIDTGVGESAPILADITGNGKPEVIFAGSDARVRVFGNEKIASFDPAANRLGN